LIKNEKTPSYLYSFSQQRGRRKTIKTGNKRNNPLIFNEKFAFSTSFDVLFFHKKINYLQNQAGNHFIFQRGRFLKSIGAPNLTISSWEIRKRPPFKNTFFYQDEEKESRAEKNWLAVCQYVSAKNQTYFRLLKKLSSLSSQAVFEDSISYLELRKALDLLTDYYRLNLS
jgi:hypothetical protein